jgi:beta-mannanase
MKKVSSLLMMIMCVGVLNARKSMPVDKMATKETVNLYNNLNKIQQKGFLVGHQDALAYGVNWKYEPGRSDIKDITGDYPALYGWELGHLEIDEKVNLDSVPFDKMLEYIQEGYQRGGVITISWHGRNPMTGKTAWDPEKGTVASILPGGDKNEVFNNQLDKVANFLLSLKGKNGEMIPVLFRPFHEHTGGWFWWGAATTNNEEYKALFRYTVNYLKDKRNVHNLLWVYNTGSEFKNDAEFLARYPGDDVIDILSFDTYQFGDPSGNSAFAANLDTHLGIIEKIANAKGKIAVVGETGYNLIPSEKWWTDVVFKGVSNHKFAYILFWRNAGLKKKENVMEYFVPYKGHTSEKDFIDFYNQKQTLFQSDISYKEMYN